MVKGGMQKNKLDIRKILFNEGSFFLALISAIVVTVLFITRPDAQFKEDIALIKQDVHLIRTNEFPHIQKEITENKEDINAILGDHQKMTEAIIRIETLFEEHLKK